MTYKHLSRLWIGGAVAIMWSSAALAQERPTTGLVHSPHEMSSIRYECHAMRDPAVITCDMVQMSVRKQSKPSELKEKLDKAMAQWKNEKPMAAEECNNMTKMVWALNGSANAELPEEARAKIAAMPAAQKQDMAKLFTAFANHCKSPSAATMAEVVRLGHEETRTCSVSTNPFTQMFKRVAGSDIWTSSDGPNGPCGTVLVSSFQKDPKYSLWTYVTQKTITNPKGELLPRLACGELDQTQQTFDWRSDDKFAKCDYIKFGAL